MLGYCERLSLYTGRRACRLSFGRKHTLISKATGLSVAGRQWTDHLCGPGHQLRPPSVSTSSPSPGRRSPRAADHRRPQLGHLVRSWVADPPHRDDSGRAADYVGHSPDSWGTGSGFVMAPAAVVHPLAVCAHLNGNRLAVQLCQPLWRPSLWTCPRRRRVFGTTDGIFVVTLSRSRCAVVSGLARDGGYARIQKWGSSDCVSGRRHLWACRRFNSHASFVQLVQP